jgi:hypothetical protein
MSQIMKGFKRLWVILVGLVLGSLPVYLFADEPVIIDHPLEFYSRIDEIVWHGFFSQNFIASDENNYLGSSSDGSFKSNEAALNASWLATESLQFSLQGLYKQTGNSKPKGGRLDYAIADWRILDNFSRVAGVRLGRLKNPYGFFNETRDVAATNISILLPQSIYIDYLSQLIHSSDSMGFYGHSELDKGTLAFNVQYGRPILNEDVTRSIVASGSSTGEFSDERAFFARLSYEDASGLWRTALMYTNFRGHFDPGPNDFLLRLSEGKLNVDLFIWSLEFNVHDLQITTEIQRRNIHLDEIYPFDIKEQNLSYYLQFAYNFSTAFKIYVRRDEAFRFKDDKHGKSYIDDSKAINPATETQFHSAFAKDTTLGFRYSPSFEWSFAMEVHQIDGTYWLPDLENRDVQNQKRYWNMFLAQIAYRF